MNMRLTNLILALFLFLATNSFAEDYDPLHGIRGSLDLHNAYVWGQMQNRLAAEAPPQRHQIEIIQRPSNSAPVPFIFPSRSARSQSDGIDIQALAKALKAAEKTRPVYEGSPFYSTPMEMGIE